MCRTGAEAAGAAGARALNLGILILVIPTLLLFLGILLFAVLRRDSAGEVEATAAVPEALRGGPGLRALLRLSWPMHLR
jgi:hypothetical protein